MQASLPQRLSAAAHAQLPQANPLSVAQMNELVEAARVGAHGTAPKTALDIGCGPASFALALAARTGLEVTAVDPNPVFIARARSALAASALRGAVRLIEAEFQPQGNPAFDVVACIGASQAFGSPRQALRGCASLVTPHGKVVFADLVWARPPDDAFVQFLGVDRDFYWPCEAEGSVFASAGLVVEHRVQASMESFLAYERAVDAGRRAFASTWPDAAEARGILQRADAWSAQYREHGQKTLGFVAWVARRAGA